MKLTSYTSIVLFAASIGSASAAAISINFSSNGNSGAAQDVLAAETAGVEAVANWNNLSGARNAGGVGGLLDDGGNATTAFITWDANGTWGGTNANDLSGDEAMMTTWLDGVIDVSISGIPYANYDVYVYGSSDTGNAGRALGWNINGSDVQTTGVFSDPTGPNGDYYFGHVDGSTPAANPTYLKFSNLSGDFLIADHAGTPAGGIRGPLSGIQIVEVVPEPSSAALLGLGGLALILRRRV